MFKHSFKGPARLENNNNLFLVFDASYELVQWMSDTTHVIIMALNLRNSELMPWGPKLGPCWSHNGMLLATKLYIWHKTFQSHTCQECPKNPSDCLLFNRCFCHNYFLRHAASPTEQNHLTFGIHDVCAAFCAYFLYPLASFCSCNLLAYRYSQSQSKRFGCVVKGNIWIVKLLGL